jgi:C_GCAxxG_C_C family probable redox protein
MESDCIPRIASPFGAGIGRSGQVCGAVSGACMAIGLVHGRSTPKDPRGPVYDATEKLVEAFVKETGTANCNELTGFDMKTPESYKAFRESGVSDRVCAPAIVLASRLAVDLLQKD